MNIHPLEEIDAQGDVSVVRVHARILNEETAQAVCGELARLVSEAGRRKLHLDIGGVEYLAAGGLSQLLALHSELLADGGGLRLCNAEGCLDLTRLHGALDHSPAGPGQPA